MGFAHLLSCQLVQHLHLVVAGGQHPRPFEAVGADVLPPGFDHPRLGGEFALPQMETTGFVVVTDCLLDLSQSKAIEVVPIEVESLSLVDRGHFVGHPEALGDDAVKEAP